MDKNTIIKIVGTAIYTVAVIGSAVHLRRLYKKRWAALREEHRAKIHDAVERCGNVMSLAEFEAQFKDSGSDNEPEPTPVYIYDYLSD